MMDIGQVVGIYQVGGASQICSILEQNFWIITLYFQWDIFWSQ
jgi:hypothetical protein